MNKFIGYIIAAIGLFGLAAANIKEVQDFVQNLIPQLAKIDSLTLTITSIVIILAGIFLITKSPFRRTQKLREVPIYKGNQIVGYKRRGI